MDEVLFEDVKFVILVTGRFHWLVEPLLYFYRKYMPVHLTFFSDRPIEGVDFVEVFPRDMLIYREPCGGLVKDALRNLDGSLLMFGYMDILPIREVNLCLVDILAQYMRENDPIARGNMWSEEDGRVLSHGVLLQEGDGYSIFGLSSRDPNVGQVGATSLLPALWNREFLLDFIEDGWTFDAIELPGQHKFARQDRWRSVAMVPGVFEGCHLCYTADPNGVRLSTIPDLNDREYVAQFVPEDRRVG